MAVIQRLTADVAVVAVGARHRFTFRAGALDMLLDPTPGLNVTRVPLERGLNNEVGELTLTPTGRTLVVRVRDPPRQFIAKADDARRLLKGETEQVKLVDVSDPAGATVPPARPSPPRAEPTAPRGGPPLPTAARSMSLDDVLKGVHACPATGLTCRPGAGYCHPLPPRGRLAGGTDVLLVGWNPRVGECPTGDMPAFDAWRAEGETALARAPWADAVAALLPEGVDLAGGRVAGTFLWKWPTRVKTGGEGERFYAARCVEKHFWDELAALRPRVVLTFHKEAAAFFADVAERHGLPVREVPAPLQNGESAGRVLTSDRWGWPMGVVLARDPDGRGYHPDTRKWARLAVGKVLEETA